MLSRLRKKVQKHKHEIPVCPEEAASDDDRETDAGECGDGSVRSISPSITPSQNPTGGKRVFNILKSMSGNGGSRKKSNAAVSLGRFQLDGTECRAIRIKPDHSSPPLSTVLSPGQVISASEIQNGWMRLSEGWTEMTPLIVPVKSSSSTCPPLLLKTATEFCLFYNEIDLLGIDKDLRNSIEDTNVPNWFSDLISQFGPWPPPGLTDLITKIDDYNYAAVAYAILLLKAGIECVPCSDESKLISAGLPPNIVKLLLPTDQVSDTLALDDILALPAATKTMDNSCNDVFSLPPASDQNTSNGHVSGNTISCSPDIRLTAASQKLNQTTPLQVLTPPYTDTRDSTFSDISPQSITSDSAAYKTDVLAMISARSDLKQYLSKEMSGYCCDLVDLGYTRERLEAEGILGNDPKIIEIISSHEQAASPLWNALSDPPSLRKMYIIKTQKSPQHSVVGIKLNDKHIITGIINKSDADYSGITLEYVGKRITNIIETDYICVLTIDNTPVQQLEHTKQIEDSGKSIAHRLFKNRSSSSRPKEIVTRGLSDSPALLLDQGSSTSYCTPQQAIIHIEGHRSRSNSMAQSVASESQESCFSYGGFSPKQYAVGQQILYSPSQALTPVSNRSPVHHHTDPCWVQGEIVSCENTECYSVRVLATEEVLKDVPSSWIKTTSHNDVIAIGTVIFVNIAEYRDFVTGEIDGVNNSGVYIIKVLGSDSATRQLTAENIRRKRSDSNLSDISLVRQATFSPKTSTSAPFPSSGSLRRVESEQQAPIFTVGQHVIFSTTSNGLLAGAIAAVHQNTYDIVPKKNPKKVLYQHWRAHNIKAALNPGDTVSYNTSSGWTDGGVVLQFSGSSGLPLYTIKSASGKTSKKWKHSNLRKVEKKTWSREQHTELQEIEEQLKSGIQLSDEMASRKEELERSYNMFIEQGLISMRKNDATGTPKSKQSTKTKKTTQLLDRLSPWNNRKYEPREVSLNTGLTQSRGMTQTLRTTLSKKPANLTTERGGRTVQEVSFLGKTQWWLLHNETVVDQHPDEVTCPLTSQKLRENRFQCRLTQHRTDDDCDDGASSVSSWASACNLTREELVKKADSVLITAAMSTESINEISTHPHLRNLYGSCKQRIVDCGGESTILESFPVTRKLFALSRVTPPDPESFAAYSPSLSFIKDKPPLPLYSFNNLLMKSSEDHLRFASLLRKAETPRTSTELENQIHNRNVRDAKSLSF